MITNAEVKEIIEKTKSLETRADAAEAKVKALETEKAQIIATKGAASMSNVVGLNSNSDEQRALRYFQKSHVKDLLNVNVGSEQYKNVPMELKQLVMGLKQVVDVARFTAQYCNQEPLDTIASEEKKDRISAVKSIADTRYGREVFASTIKAFGSGVSGAGAEWVPFAVSQTHLDEYELKRVLEARFRTVPMPTPTFDMPKIKDVTKARIATEGQSNFQSNNFGTDKIRFTAKKLEEFYVLPEELDEDSAPDFMAAGRAEVIASQERAAEAAMISGDSDGTHQDSDTQAGAADLAEKAWDGLRKLAIANSGAGSTLDFANAAVSEVLLSTLTGRMGKYGSNPDECLILAGPVVYQQLLNLPSVVTMDKFGQFATVLKGALAAYQGKPIVNTEWFREDLNASGVYDGVTTTRSAIIIVNTKRFYIGQRRPISVKLMPDLPGSDRWLLASYRRVDFKGHTQSATEKSVVYGYNIAK